MNIFNQLLWVTAPPLIIVVFSIFWASRYAKSAQQKYQGYLDQHQAASKKNFTEAERMNQESMQTAMEMLEELKAIRKLLEPKK